jgi:protein-disulfide isomerase-like protein with CxxC motif
VTAQRLASVDAVRRFQRDWLQRTRERVAGGTSFVICNGDEAEELCQHLGIPVLVINYWNSLIAIQQKTAHYREVLHQRGYPGNHFFALGYASTLDPAQAPWGGLPKPSLIVGSGRWESEMRVTELWALEYGCEFYPLDFNMSAVLVDIPTRWWERTRDHWRELVEHRRLAERAAQERGLLRRLEQISGRRFDADAFNRSMDLLNAQMDEWQAAQTIIAATRPCPVSLRDQMSIYQAMWHRGSEDGLDLIRAYRKEVEARAVAGIGAAPAERFRLFYNAQAAPWAEEIEARFGAVVVACSYTGIPALYARTVYDSDALTALAARHLFLFNLNPEWVLHNVVWHQCDAAIVHEAHPTGCASAEQTLFDTAGIPYLAIAGGLNERDERQQVTTFIEERLIAQCRVRI